MAKRLKIKLGQRSTRDSIELLQAVAKAFPAMDHIEIDGSGAPSEEVKSLPAAVIAQIRDVSTGALEASSEALTEKPATVPSPNSLKTKVANFLKVALIEGWKATVGVAVKKLMGEA